jgi:hypothetical protein
MRRKERTPAMATTAPTGRATLLQSSLPGSAPEITRESPVLRKAPAIIHIPTFHSRGAMGRKTRCVLS